MLSKQLVQKWCALRSLTYMLRINSTPDSSVRVYNTAPSALRRADRLADASVLALEAAVERMVFFERYVACKAAVVAEHLGM
jgi:hypothetical protein